MNPFFELDWSDIHLTLISSIREALSAELPIDLRVRGEEQVRVTSTEREYLYRSDVTIRENWKNGFPPLWQPETGGGSGILVAEPEIVMSEPEVERWLEIRDSGGTLVTALEVLSPRNKTGAGWQDYRNKQMNFLAAGVNLVEIDLLRGGLPTVAVDPDMLTPRSGTQYIICVSRALIPSRHEVYRCGLRERLPAFRVPLRPGDPDVPLDLQPMIDRCYVTGRYWASSDPTRLSSKFPEDEAKWIAERLQQ
jgi:hypothetical protein